MPIIVNLDVMLAKRKMRSKDLAMRSRLVEDLERRYSSPPTAVQRIWLG